MTGRYTGEVRLRISGNPDVAAEYVGAGREIVQQVLDMMNGSGIETLQRIYTFETGVQVTGRVIGGVREILIKAPTGNTPSLTTPKELPKRRRTKEPVCWRDDTMTEYGLIYGPAGRTGVEVIASPDTGEAFVFGARAMYEAGYNNWTTLVVLAIDGTVRFSSEYERTGEFNTRFVQPTEPDVDSEYYFDPVDYTVGGVAFSWLDFMPDWEAKPSLDLPTRTIRYNLINPQYSGGYTAAPYRTGPQTRTKPHYPIVSQWYSWAFNARTHNYEVVPYVPELSALYRYVQPSVPTMSELSRNQLGGGHWLDPREMIYDGQPIPVPYYHSGPNADGTPDSSRAGGHGIAVYCPPTKNVWVMGNVNGAPDTTFGVMYVYDVHTRALTQAKMPWEGVTVPYACIAVDIDTGAVVIYDESTKRLIAFNVPNCWNVRDTISTPPLNIPPGAFGAGTVVYLSVARGNVYLAVRYPSQPNESPGRLTAIYGVHIPALALGAVIYSELPDTPEEL